jgi:ferric-chelate reductase
MTRTYEGVDCLKDIDTDRYAILAEMAAMGKKSFYYQPVYAKWELYFGTVLIFLVLLRHLWYRYDDWTYRNEQKNFLAKFKRLVSLFRIIGYKRLPVMLSRITGLPASFGTLLLLAASIIFIVCVCFGPGSFYRPCRGMGTAPLATRSGFMVLALTPFLIVVSGKTNFISFVTGVSYEKLNIFHQALGWGSLFLTLVHTIVFLTQPVWEGGLANLRDQWNSDEMYSSGVPPLVLLFILCFFSTRLSRKWLYEFWWHTHWIMAFAYLGLLTYHVYDVENAQAYIWGTLGFWGFQMLYRLVVKTTLRPNEYSFKSKEASLKGYPNDVFEVSIDIKSKNELNWSPGQHVFIRFVMGVHTLDNHPFSILTTPVQGTGELKLLVKSQRGLTKKLYKMIGDKSLKLRCYIDGPYGGMARDPLSFDKLILVASGTGITVTFPFLQLIAQNLNNLSNRVREVEFIWIVSSMESLHWIQNELDRILEENQDRQIFNIKIFVTNSKEGINPEITSSRDFSTSESSLGIKNEQAKSCAKIFNNSKPNLKTYLPQTQLMNKTAVICSGTASLQRDCGSACSRLQQQVIKGEIEEVYMHTENFGW